MKVRILCTLGPSSLRPEVIARLDERGVDLFRVNLSHTPLEAVAPTIELVRGCSKTPICLDTEGAQVRCGVMSPGVVLEEGRTVRLTAAGRIGTGEELVLQPAATLGVLRPGSLLSVDFGGALLRVTEAGPEGASALVVEGGPVRSNKAVTVDPAPGWSGRAGPAPATWRWRSTPAAAPGSCWRRWPWTPASSRRASTPCWSCWRWSPR